MRPPAIMFWSGILEVLVLLLALGLTFTVVSIYGVFLLMMKQIVRALVEMRWPHLVQSAEMKAEEVLGDNEAEDKDNEES